MYNIIIISLTYSYQYNHNHANKKVWESSPKAFYKIFFEQTYADNK